MANDRLFMKHFRVKFLVNDYLWQSLLTEKDPNFKKDVMEPRTLDSGVKRAYDEILRLAEQAGFLPLESESAKHNGITS